MAPTTIFIIGIVTTALLMIFTVETVVLLRRSGEAHPAALPGSMLVRAMPGERPWARPMRVMLAVDGSPCSQAAIQSVSARAWPAGTEVDIATVVHTRIPNIPEITLMGSAAHVQALEEDRERAPVRIEAARRALAGRPDIAVHTTTLEGDPARSLLEEAERWKADLVVLGSHGYGPVKKMALGSVSQAVATQAHCSVEIVRCPEAQGKAM